MDRIYYILYPLDPTIFFSQLSQLILIKSIIFHKKHSFCRWNEENESLVPVLKEVTVR